MKRRSLIIAATVAPVALVAPTLANTSRLRAVYHRWLAAKGAYAALPADCTPEAEALAFREIETLEQQAADFMPRCLEDMAFKIIFADDNGNMSVNPHQKALVSGAYAIAGIKHPP